MLKIFRVCRIEVDNYHHFKSFLKKEDAEIFLEELKVKMIKSLEILDRNCEIRTKLLKKVMQEFSIKEDLDFLHNEDASNRYNELCNALELEIPEMYYSEEEIETVKIFEEDVF